MSIRHVAWLLIGLSLLAADACATPPTGRLAEQQFDRYSEFARIETIIERMYRTPEHRRAAEVSAQRWLEHLVATNRGLDESVLDTPIEFIGHTVNLDGERFDMFVPLERPEKGYGLLVYLPPNPVFRIPRRWRNILGTRGIILVAPRNAGNRDSLVLRRFPLALHALENVTYRYPVDSARTYVGGWSGGSRTALALALAYPELFRGALLIAGTDPIDNNDPALTRYGDRLNLFPNPLPADETLAARLLTDSRMVMLTGELDRELLRRDTQTLQSMREAGIDGSSIRMPGTDHVLPEARWLERALRVLDGEMGGAPPYGN